MYRIAGFIACLVVAAPAFAATNSEVTSAAPNVEKTTGQALYKAHCALCHGGKGQGVPPMFPGLNSKPIEAYAAMMQNYRAGHGHKVMVDMAKSLTEVQIQELLAYMATFPPKK
ncbi:MAG: cytochrome c [Halothiobacillaceae bacterium]